MNTKHETLDPEYAAETRAEIEDARKIALNLATRWAVQGASSQEDVAERAWKAALEIVRSVYWSAVDEEHARLVAPLEKARTVAP